MSFICAIRTLRRPALSATAAYVCKESSRPYESVGRPDPVPGFGAPLPTIQCTGDAALPVCLPGPQTCSFSVFLWRSALTALASRHRRRGILFLSPSRRSDTAELVSRAVCNMIDHYEDSHSPRHFSCDASCDGDECSRFTSDVQYVCCSNAHQSELTSLCRLTIILSLLNVLIF